MFRKLPIIFAFTLMSTFFVSCSDDDAATPTAAGTTSTATALPAATIGCGSDGTEPCMN